MSEAPLSAQNAESGVVVQFVPSTALPSVPGGVRTVGLIGKGEITKLVQSSTITRSGTLSYDVLTPKATALPANIMDVNMVQYTRDLDYILSYGTSVSGGGASADLSAHATPGTFKINLNGDGVQTVSITTTLLTTGSLIAAAIQVAVRALTPISIANALVYSDFTAVFAAGVYTLTSGVAGASSSAVVTVGTLNDIAGDLKLGITNTGTERAGGDVDWSPAFAAAFTGSVDLSGGITFATPAVFSIIVHDTTGSGYVDQLQAVTLSGVYANAAAVQVALSAGFLGVTVSVVSSKYIKVETTETDNASLSIGNGSANTLLGFFGGLIALSPKEPVAAVTYSLTYNTPKVTADYAPQFFSSHDQLMATYGDPSVANSLSLGSQLIFENSGNTGGIVAVQINPADQPDLLGYINALNRLAAVENVNIVVPLTADPNLYSFVLSHVVNSSAPLEKKERTSILGLQGNPSVAQATGYAAALASGGNGRRIMLVYPSSVTMLLNGTETALDGSFLAAAVAGIRINANYDVAEPLLRKEVTGFQTVITGLLRTDKLLLRNGGVTVIETIDTIARITEDTTADRSTVDGQEFAVTEITDFTAKVIRRLLENIFIGVKLLPDTPNLVIATIQTILDNLVALTILNSYSNIRSTINSLDPRQIDVSFKIQPVRTLRWINVKFTI